MKKYSTEKYEIYHDGFQLVGMEKEHNPLKSEDLVHIQRLERAKKLQNCLSEAFNIINANEIISSGDKVAIKINLGGGIDGILSTYSDPKICEAIIKEVKSLGGLPFICEADMRAHIMDDKMLKKRGYYRMLKKQNTKFINLSEYSTVKMECRGLELPLLLPEILLKPEIKIISFAPPKHHWECGITANQKNMYGGIAEQKKSIYHRKYERIDKVVAAAARMMAPDINILATYNLGAGMGPHFCIPIPFNRMIISRDMIRGDKVTSEILGYPFKLIEYAMINTRDQDVSYKMHPDADWPSDKILNLIKENSIDYNSVKFWKPALWLQYFVPHRFQIKAYPPFEFILTLLNKAFLKNNNVLLKAK